MRNFNNIVVSLIIGLSMIITAKILASAFSSSVNSSDGITQVVSTIADNIRDSNRYQMQIVTEHGINWNGIYVLDKQTGRVKFYASSESF